MQQRKFKRLLPAGGCRRGIEESPSEPPAKRKKARIACNQCRAKRAACDTKRPGCSRCNRLSLECVYITDDSDATPAMVLRRENEILKQQLKEHTDFQDLLHAVPELEAVAAVRYLRLTKNPSKAISLLKGSAHAIYGPSQFSVYRAILPPTQSGVEFELALLHQSVYPALEPLDTKLMTSMSLLKSTRCMLQSPNRAQGSMFSSVAPLRKSISNETSHQDKLLFSREDSIRESPVPETSRDIQYCDSRLSQLRVKYWTAVPISDELAASAISHYLEVYHPILGFFDADLFLADLLSQQLNFCSSFLFNALMSFACQSYTAIDMRSYPYQISFWIEAEKLWKAERSSDSPTILAALSLLSATASLNGKDSLGNYELLAEVREMAKRLRIFDIVPTEELIHSFHKLPKEKIRELAHIAWGAYGWYTCCSSYFPKEPIRYPPTLPIPGKTNRKSDRAPELTWPPHPLPTYMRPTFSALCEFWIIVQEIHVVYNTKDNRSLIGRVSPTFAETKYQKLLKWADELRSVIALNDNSASHVFVFHALYHTTILNLFRPFLEPPHIFHLRSLSSKDGTSLAIFSASFKQLKRLIYNYRTRCLADIELNCIFAVAVLHVSSIIVKQNNTDPTWKFYFRLCFEFWKDASVCFRVFQAFVPAHLSLALQAGAITSHEARALMEEFKARGKHHTDPEDELSSAMLEFDRGIQKEGDATVDVLAEKFEELVMFDEFTTGEF